MKKMPRDLSFSFGPKTVPFAPRQLIISTMFVALARGLKPLGFIAFFDDCKDILRIRC